MRRRHALPRTQRDAAITAASPDYTGMSFHQFLLNARLNAAEDLLYTGRYTVNEVAELTGFQDASYFSRVFFRANGIRPGKYKRLEKPPEPRDQEKPLLPGTAGQDRFS